MKSHITDTELRELTALHHHWSQMRIDQDQCVRRVAALLDCDEHEANDLLNIHSSISDVVNAKGIEVHREEHCQTPIEPMRRTWVDGETMLVWGLIVCGVGWVVSAVGIGF